MSKRGRLLLVPFCVAAWAAACGDEGKPRASDAGGDGGEVVDSGSALKRPEAAPFEPLPDAGPVGCFADGEAFDLCDSFDDKGAHDNFAPPWGSVAISQKANLERSTETFRSPPNSFLAGTPATPATDASFLNVAQVTKTFFGNVSRVVIDWSLRLDGPGEPWTLPTSFGLVVFGDSADRQTFHIQTKPSAIDAGDDAIAPPMFGAESIGNGANVLAQWLNSPAFGTWHHVRWEFTVLKSTNELAELIRLDGVTVVDRLVAISTNFSAPRVSISIGLLAPTQAGSPQPAWRVFHDDIKVAVER